MKLSGQKPQVSKPKMSVAAAFNQDSDDEPEEMPREARMRMRNIGRYFFCFEMKASNLIIFPFKRYPHIIGT